MSRASTCQRCRPIGTSSAQDRRRHVPPASLASPPRAAGLSPPPWVGSGSRVSTTGRAPGRRAGSMSHGQLLVFELTILVLAIFLGFEVISKVPTLLHTPLMSGTNAIHGIVIVGAIIVAGSPDQDTLDVDRRLRRRRPRARRTSSAASSSPTGCSRCSRSASRRRGRGARTARAEHEPNLANLALPGHDRLLHPRAALPLEPGARAARQLDRRGRDGVAIVVTFAPDRHRRAGWAIAIVMADRRRLRGRRGARA